MKNKILIFALFSVVVIVGFWVYQKQEPKQTIQESRIQRDISAIRKFYDSSDLAVQFESESKSSNGVVVPVNVYIAGSDRYEIDANGKIIEFGSRNLPIGSENEKITGNSTRYNQQELEVLAKQFVRNASDVNLDKLIFTQNTKGANYFFRWEDKSQKSSEGYPFIQIGFSQGGTVLNYINALR